MNVNSQKGFANIVLIVLVVILAGAVGYFALVKKSPTPTSETQTSNNLSPQQTPPVNTTQTPPPSSQTNNQGWKKYSGASLEFEYPSLISTKQEGETITLNHSIVYKHTNPCNFKGDAPPLDKLSDFGVSLMVSNKNLKDAVQTNEGSDYVVKNFFENNTLKLSEGFIDRFNAGSLNGFQITSGAEGCGRYTYYFPMSSTKTLVVNRSFISEFSPVNGDYQTYLNLSGIIPPNQEKEFFVKILSSLKVK
ncbi:MAG: hypothetical protein Q8Q46_00040 [Candidatus Giovannonibacteria bacterium]|nr:hypothetical protein [Candidatus Giovannonibacteria bacterium]